tara:strand:- start:269 stop:559 length:291 start_codon:yes stop_codon:yes gene_type:complete
MAAEKREDDRALLWMFNNDKSNDRQPDMTGPGRINKRVLKGLVDAYREHGDGENLKLRCAAWEKEGKNGSYIFVTIEPDLPRENVPEKKVEDDIPF